MTDTTVSRRQFITTALTAAGGFALGIGIAGPAQAASLGARGGSDRSLCGKKRTDLRDRLV